MGQRVRQLNAERKFDEARRVAQERLTLASATYGKEHLVTATGLATAAPSRRCSATLTAPRRSSSSRE